jgi:hypothetical protein
MPSPINSGGLPFSILQPNDCIGDSLGYFNSNLQNTLSLISTVSATTTTLNNSFGVSLSSQGYQKLPGGLIMQWGTFKWTATPGPDPAAITWKYPIPFPNAVFNISITPQISAGPVNNNYAGYVKSTTLNSAVVGLDDVAGADAVYNAPVYISVIGY